MLNDNTSLVAPVVVKNLISGLEASSLSKNEKEAVSILNSWKGTNNTGDVGPTIYNKLIYMYLKNTYKDELGRGVYTVLATHIMKQLIATQIVNEKSPWWDNVETKNRKESRSEILSKSFKEAIAVLENQLGKSVPLDVE
jgi:penicillin amidase